MSTRKIDSKSKKAPANKEDKKAPKKVTSTEISHHNVDAAAAKVTEQTNPVSLDLLTEALRVSAICQAHANTVAETDEPLLVTRAQAVELSLDAVRLGIAEVAESASDIAKAYAAAVAQRDKLASLHGKIEAIADGLADGLKRARGLQKAKLQTEYDIVIGRWETANEAYDTAVKACNVLADANRAAQEEYLPEAREADPDYFKEKWEAAEVDMASKQRTIIRLQAANSALQVQIESLQREKDDLQEVLDSATATLAVLPTVEEYQQLQGDYAQLGTTYQQEVSDLESELQQWKDAAQAEGVQDPTGQYSKSSNALVTTDDSDSFSDF